MTVINTLTNPTLSSNNASETDPQTNLTNGTHGGSLAELQADPTETLSQPRSTNNTQSLTAPPADGEKLNAVTTPTTQAPRNSSSLISAENDPDSFLSSRYYRLYQLDKTIGELEETTADLANTLETVANKRQAEAKQINADMARINNAKDTTGLQLSALSEATKSFGIRTLKTAALTGTAIGSLVLASGLLKAYLATSTIDRSLSTSSLGLMSMALYQLYHSTELSQVTQAGRRLFNNVAEIGQSGMALFNTVAHTSADILDDVGEIAQAASRTSSIANRALKDVRGT